MSMQEKGRKHGADRQNFLRKRGRAGELTSVSRRGRPRPYINVASWEGARRMGKNCRLPQALRAGTSRRPEDGGFWGSSFSAILACGRRLAVVLSGELSACGIFRAAWAIRAEWWTPSYAPGMLRQACLRWLAMPEGACHGFSFLSCFRRILQSGLGKSSIFGCISHGLFVR